MIKILILLILIVSCIYLLSKTPVHLDAQTIEACKIGAIQNQKDFKNTKWANLDFYKMCIENVACATPIKPCKE